MANNFQQRDVHGEAQEGLTEPLVTYLGLLPAAMESMSLDIEDPSLVGVTTSSPAPGDKRHKIPLKNL